jgi:ferrous iron transport protein A
METRTAAELRKGEVQRIGRYLSDELASCLLGLGLLPGASIEYIRSAPFGCPVYFKVANSRIVLRKQQAALIELK